jgi:hypothetical protein
MKIVLSPARALRASGRTRSGLQTQGQRRRIAAEGSISTHVRVEFLPLVPGRPCTELLPLTFDMNAGGAGRLTRRDAPVGMNFNG